MTDFSRDGGDAGPASVERLLHEPGATACALGPPAAWPEPLRYGARFMFDSATPCFIGWGPDARMLYNDAALPLLGERHPALLGRPLGEALPAAWAALQPAIRRALAGEAFQLEQPAVELARPAVSEAGAAGAEGGGERLTWLNLSFAPLRALDGAILGFSCIVNDTTALRESEARFRAITDAMPQMVWSTRPDGYHDYYNQRWYDFTGMRPGETDGARWADMFHPDDRAHAWKLWRHSLATGEQYEVEYRLRHHSGSYRWVLGRALAVRDTQGRIVRWMGTCTDIEQQKRGEEALQDAQLRLSAALVAADLGTWTYDLKTDRVYADPNLAGLFGIDARQAAGGHLATYLEMVHPDDIAHTRAAIGQAAATAKATSATTGCARRTAAGATCWRAAR